MPDEKQFLDYLRGLTHKQTMLLALELQRRVDGLEGEGADDDGGDAGPVALTGMGCRFPGAGEGPAAFHAFLRAGGDGVGPVPPERWDAEAWYHPDPGRPDHIACRTGGFLDRVDGFDAALFGLSPREALSLDPQHRMLLETAWAALEDAGLPPDRLGDSRTGVFVGASTNDYGDLLRRVPDLPPDSYYLSGNALNFAAGRLAFTLGLTGPALTVDTACSSSLVALHLAARAVRAGDCDRALVGGVNLILSPFSSLVASRARMLSPTGRCRAFDAAADGMVRGEGCGVVVVERAADAERARRRIRARVRGSAVNQNGASSGITTPSRQAQEAVVRHALRRAGARPRDLAFVETHGTGTPLGDPIEAHALGAVLADDGGSALAGSVKTNIGHLESAAGMAGLIKTVLTLEAGEAPPHLHLRTPNPAIDWPRVPLRLPARPTPLEAPGERPMAGVGSLGGSGTNAHVILEAGPSPAPAAPAADPPGPHVVPVGAMTAPALAAALRRMADTLADDGPDAPPLAAVARAAALNRAHPPLRRTIVADDRPAAVAALRAAAEHAAGPAMPARRGGVTFLFSGQGALYAGAGLGALADEPAFRAELEAVGDHLAPFLDRPLPDVLGDADRLADSRYGQPALFALQMALVAQWAAWGVKPAAVAGHSLGAFAAAAAAGVLSVADAARLVAVRGRLVAEGTRPGAMTALTAGRATAERLIAATEAPDLAVSALNAPDETVIAGDPDAVDRAEALAAAEGLRWRRLETAHAFHSPLMDPILDAWSDTVSGVALADPAVPMACCLEGDMAPPGRLSRPAYWRDHLRRPVAFDDALCALADRGPPRFLEIGPKGVLTALARRRDTGANDGVRVTSLRPDRRDAVALREALGALHEAGVDPDWTAVAGDQTEAPPTLPSYPFDRRRFWPPTTPPLPPDVAPEAGIGAYHVAPVPVAAPPPVPHASAAAGRWLLDVPAEARDAPLVGALEARLRALGGTVVRADDAPADAPDGPPRALVRFACLDAPGDTGDPAAACRPLPAALARAERHATRLWLVTRGAWPVQAGSRDQAPATAFLRAAALDHPARVGGQIDLDAATPADATAEAGRLAALLVADTAEDLLSWRHDTLLAARLRPSAPPRAAGADTPGWQADARGLYLVTGGLGGLGRHMATWLAHRGAGALVLTGRNAPDAEGERFLGELGVPAEHRAVDAADPDAMATLLAELRGRGLKGVVHAAGVAVDGDAAALPAEAVTRQFAAKAGGGRAIADGVADADLDLLVFCSSAAATWGSRGLAAYAAANGYLDALAADLGRRGLPALSIAWGPWRGTGLSGSDVPPESGSAAATAEDAFAGQGVGALDPADALAALDGLAAQARAGHAPLDGAVTVADVTWSRLRPLLEARRARPLLHDLPGAESPAGSDRTPAPAAPEPAPASDPAQGAGGLLDGVPRWDRPAAVESLVCAAAARARGLPRDQVHGETVIADMGLDSLMVMDVLEECRRALDITLYPRDIQGHRTLGDFAAHVAAEAERLAPPADTDSPSGEAAAGPAEAPAPAATGAEAAGPGDAGAETAAPDAVFILSSPRSGSTLLRVMLAGHPALFCPPELHLLPYDTLAGWRADLAGTHLDEGLLHAVMERHDLTAGAARARLDTWAESGVGIDAVYADLAHGPAGAAPRLVVDKSPSYASDPAALARAERLFRRPLYIHLTRHPAAVIDSIVRNRMDRVMGAAEDSDPHAAAEALWLVQNRALSRFLGSVPAARQRLVAYEDLVTAPEAVMRRLADFLGVAFDPAMLHPYDGDRMTRGVYGASLSIGDPNFRTRDSIEPALAERWRDARLPRPLGAATRLVARDLGYAVATEQADSTAAAEARAAARALEADPAAAGARRRLAGLGLPRPLWRALDLGFRADPAAGDGAGRLVAARTTAEGTVTGLAPFDAADAPADLPLGLRGARDAIRRDGYAIILPDARRMAEARHAGLETALGGPVTEAGRLEAAALGGLVFDLSDPDGGLRTAGLDPAASAAAPDLPGTFAIHHVDSTAVGDPVAVATYTPSGMADGAAPLIVVLPGAEATLAPRLAALPARLFADGVLPPVRLAWVQAPRTLYLDPPAGGPLWETFVAEELPGHLNATAVGMVGASMGGLGVLRAALRRPRGIPAVAALAPAIEAAFGHDDIAPGDPLAWLRPPPFLARLFGDGIDDAGQWAAHHPPVLARDGAADLRHAGTAISLACGDADPLAWPGTWFLHRVLEGGGVPHDLDRDPDGRHDNAFFAMAMPRALTFVARRLAHGPAGPS